MTISQTKLGNIEDRFVGVYVSDHFNTHPSWIFEQK